MKFGRNGHKPQSLSPRCETIQAVVITPSAQQVLKPCQSLEIHEALMMRDKGMTYDQAHKRANAGEKQLRQQSHE